jgi:ATP-dependent DNA helicase RecG
MVRDLSELDIQYMKGVGPRKAALLKRLNIKSVLDAIMHFPHRYEDRRDVRSIRDITPGAVQTVVGSVESAEVLELGRAKRGLFGHRGGRGSRGGRGGLKLFELTVADGSGSIKAKWFNQPYLKGRFKPGAEVVLSGLVKATNWGMDMENPEYELPDGEEDGLIHTARIVPVYGTTEGLGGRQLRGMISSAIRAHLHEVVDPFPAEVLRRLRLPGLGESIIECHFPDPGSDLEALNSWRTKYQRRLSFDELFMLEAGFALLRKDRVRERGISLKSEGALLERFTDALPFSLTRAQLRVFEEIRMDMQSPYPMNRLLQGDVGSGKTAVALMAVLTASECGYQSAIMAPTEILAEQHYINTHGILEKLGLRVALLTGSTRDRPLRELASGEVDAVVGTHAIIQEGTRFKRLGLAVIDEQHRFGVMQRAELRRKALNPDVLIMTATPIPRTLALTLYGDLDYSVIDELPPGRAPVSTRLYMAEEKDGIYGEIAREVENGGQVYVVYPAIEESGKTGLKSALQGEEGFKERFPRMRTALIHGRLKPARREEVMAGFKRGEIDILVSTTVIEVGVDVPNASMMLIVHAERFGLSQLHQLRGRVGRGRRRSRCLLLAYGPLSEEAGRRLKVMTRTTDGFKVAEEDLRIRGPGEFMGTRQSGLPDLKVANILRDAALLEPARREAFSLVEKDPEFKGNPLLREALGKFWWGRIELFNTG